MAMPKTITIDILEMTFDPDAALAKFRARNQNAGAVVSFLGQVRSEGDNVDALELEHYPGYTEKYVHAIARTAFDRWALDDLYVIHRVGRMAPGEAIVLVATASAHRRAAFEATDFMMDYLKSEAPFWKKEIRGGVSHWIEPRCEDYQDKARWRVSGAK